MSTLIGRQQQEGHAMNTAKAGEPRPRAGLRTIATRDLKTNPLNPRDKLEDLEELTASVRTNGVLQPVLVNDVAGDLFVIDGHRRWAAAQRAQVPRLLCIVFEDVPNHQVLTQMLTTAMHQQLRPLEQARAFQELVREGMTIHQISLATGHSETTIRARLLLLDLPEEAQDLVDDESPTLGQAVELAKQVKAKGSGGARVGNKDRHFDRGHPLARQVQDLCTHAEENVMIGNTGCGSCWEAAIRADERAAVCRAVPPASLMAVS